MTQHLWSPLTVGYRCSAVDTALRYDITSQILMILRTLVKNETNRQCTICNAYNITGGSIYQVIEVIFIKQFGCVHDYDNVYLAARIVCTGAM